MKKITSLFVYNKVGSNGEPKAMVCINNDTFVSAVWLSKVAGLPVHLFRLLIGSSIAVTHFITGENMATQEGAEPVLCTTDNKVVKDFVIEDSANLMVARLVADKLAA